ncbi:L-asparagine permease [Corynebacterium stationis]|uniref:amino acid permease n=1 Tax=Corynebacterium stationis TaxID=1705 RepID=UPI0009503772|nr:amino acid permease [Corynebacterium stationis]APT94145.1 L-asparagine permease [Corynebacterium stationis]
MSTTQVSGSAATTKPANSATESAITAGDGDYHKGLSTRQVNVIAIGGAIGTGLFMGAGGRLAQAGPGIVISYAICGELAFLILRALGELEFWFALIKVVALSAFLVAGCYFVVFGTPIEGHTTGWSLIQDNGGILPNGILPVLVLMQGVVFAYASIELLGTAAGEVENPEKVMPKAINTVIFRIAIFYVGSLILLSLLLPYVEYKAGESPFVTFFGAIGVPGMDVVMNLVVLTAAMSSLNAGLYSTGRILRSMSLNGSAPKFAGRISANGVPYGGIVITSVVAAVGVVLNAIVPAQAFEIVLNFAAIGIIASWGMIMLCHIALVKKSERGQLQRPSFRMPFAPYSSWFVLVALVFIVVLMAFDNPVGTWTVAGLLVIIPILIAGWYACRGRIYAIAAERAAAGQEAATF